MSQVSNSPQLKQSINPEWRYEAAIAAVETIIGQLETGELPLAEVFEQFQTAVAALTQCETFLREKQDQVDLLIQTLTPLD